MVQSFVAGTKKKRDAPVVGQENIEREVFTVIWSKDREHLKSYNYSQEPSVEAYSTDGFRPSCL